MENKQDENRKLTKQEARVILDNFAFGNLFGDNETDNLSKIIGFINLFLLLLLLVKVFFLK